MRTITSIGIELEGGLGFNELRQIENEYSKTGCFSITTDGSVHVPNKEYSDIELRFYSTKPMKVYDFIKFCFAYGLKQNESCGNHLHVKTKDIDNNIRLLSYGKAINKFLRAYYTKFTNNPKYLERLNNSYCSGNITPTKIRQMFTDGSRYYAVNLHSYLKHRTLEIRVLPYVESADELIKAIKWTIRTLDNILAKPNMAITKTIKTQKDELAFRSLYNDIKPKLEKSLSYKVMKKCVLQL